LRVQMHVQASEGRNSSLTAANIRRDRDFSAQPFRVSSLHSANRR
jgi:hypothetical protein